MTVKGSKLGYQGKHQVEKSLSALILSSERNEVDGLKREYSLASAIMGVP